MDGVSFLKHIEKMAAEYKEFEDNGRSGRPKDATTGENVKVIHILVMCDRRRNLRSKRGIGFGAVKLILTQILGMSKVSARWVQRMLIDDQKRTWLDISRYLLSCYEDDWSNFIKRFVSQDETWVNHFHPESKMQSKQLKHPGSPLL